MAYVGPEEVLFSPEFAPPPTSRTAEERVAEQRAAAAQQRAEAYENLRAAAPDEEPAPPDGVLGSEPEFTDLQELLDLLQQNQNDDKVPSYDFEAPDGMDDDSLHGAAPEDTRSTRDERILERIERNQWEGNLRGSAGELETLHSGAPLTPTGPGLLLLGTALMAGAGLTLRRPGVAQTKQL